MASTAAPTKASPATVADIGDTSITASDRAAHQSRKDEMKRVFAAMPRVQVRVQEDTPVQINGYEFFIKGKTRVMVPELVAEVLEQSGLI